MDLFDLLVCSEKINKAGENYFLHNAQNADPVLDDKTIAVCATIIPNIEDCTAIMSMVANFIGHKNLSETQDLISRTMGVYAHAKTDGGVEKIKFIQELIRTTIQHADFSPNYKKIFNSGVIMNAWLFYNLIPARLGPSVTNGIIKNKNYLPIYEAIGKMVDKCVSVKNEVGLVIDSDECQLDVEVIAPDLFAINFVKYNFSNKCVGMPSIKFNIVKNIEIDEDMFKRYIKYVNHALVAKEFFFNHGTGPGTDE